MLVLVGLGLETKDISVRALEEIKKADRLFIETYTAFISDDYLPFIEKEAGKKAEKINRKDLEDNVKEVVAMAKREMVALLFVGDPLIATTHNIVLNEAARQNVKYKVMHSTSVLSVAIGESGLNSYNFGPVVTVPFWFKNYKPVSFLDALSRNVKNKEHTLMLLDIDQVNAMPMKIEEATEILVAAEAEKKTGLVKFTRKIMILANVGKKSQSIMYLQIKDINSKVKKALEGKALSLVFPSRMNFVEEESVERVTRNYVHNSTTPK